MLVILSVRHYVVFVENSVMIGYILMNLYLMFFS